MDALISNIGHRGTVRPAWCAVDYHDEPHPEDRRCESEVVPVPTVMLFRFRSQVTGRIEQVADVADFSIVATQWAGDAEVWVRIGGDAQRIEVTLESARRLHRTLGVFLADNFG